MSATMAFSDGSSTLTFLTHEGEVQLSGETALDISSPGVPGHSKHRRGVKGAPFSILTTHLFTTAVARKAGMVAYFAAKTKLTTFTDRHGSEWNNIYVDNVRIIDAPTMGVAVGGGRFVLTAEWILENHSTSFD